MAINRLLRVFSALVALVLSLFTFASSLSHIVQADDTQGKELTQIITGIELLNSNDAKETETADGSYELRTSTAYKYRVTFDLSKYNDNLSDGDYFTFDIPAPTTVYEEHQSLTDAKTGVDIADLEVKANGDNLGGTVKITMKNLRQYLEKTGADKIVDVVGDFGARFRILSDLTGTKINFNSPSLINSVTHTYTTTTTNGTEEGHENFAKNGGLSTNTSWSSEKLKAIGAVSEGFFTADWRVRVNTAKQNFGDNLVLHDRINSDSIDYALIQYIPETLKVYKMDLTNSTTAAPEGTPELVEGDGYTVSWNENFTSFDIIFKDGASSYLVTYSTTTPNDGSKYANTIALTKADGTSITQRSNNTRTTVTIESDSKYAGTVVASSAYQIKINKVNSFTLAPVEGAVYTVTAEDDPTETVEVTTDETGRALTKAFAEKWKDKVFLVKEKTAPNGFELDSQEYKVTLGEDGSSIYLTDKPVSTQVSVSTKKILTGRALKEGEFTFNLYNTNNLRTPIATTTNKADGTILFENIEVKGPGTFNYVIREEVKTGDEAKGITFDDSEYAFTITAAVETDGLKATVTPADASKVFTNIYTPTTDNKVKVSVTKTWNDANNQDGKRPGSITVKLLANGQDTGKTLTLSQANGWAGEFTELDADNSGNAIVYTVEESAVPGYKSAITGNAETGFAITNSYTPETVDIKATKNWDDANNQDGKRPESITINLLADGQKVDSQEVKPAQDGTWTAEFKSKAKKKDGKEIKYTVTEEAVKEYETVITDFNIVNKYTPKTVPYQVTKKWDDADNQDGKRPTSVTVQLYKSVDGSTPVAVEGKTLVITAEGAIDANTWTGSFTDLPQFENGKEITYSVSEINVPEGYTGNVEGQLITNTHTPETIVISGKKVWEDNNNQDGKRTTTVKVQVLKDGQVVDEIEVSEATGWNFQSKELPKYEGGKEIAYEVKEVAVTSYESKVEKSADGKYTVTNTHAPEKTEVVGQKIWNDANNKDGIRPDSIVVQLFANGKDTGLTAVASEATGWKFEFKGLDRYKDGKEITYSVKEATVPAGYTSTVNGYNITNSHIPKEEPRIPGTPGQPTPKPNTPPTNDKPKGDGNKTTSKKEGRILPNTGETFSILGVIGFAVLTATGFVFFKKRQD